MAMMVGVGRDLELIVKTGANDIDVPGLMDIVLIAVLRALPMRPLSEPNPSA
jgi:hypothetical protein